jgi:hypothetical protein
MIPARYRPWTLGLYPLAGLLFLQPFIEAGAATWPPRLAEVGWRFASVGILYTMLPTLLFSLLIAAIAAFLLEHRTPLRIVGVAALVLAVAIVLLSTGFILDAVQLRRIVRPDARGGYDLTAIKALITAIVAITACAMLGVGAFRATRRLPGQERTRRRTAGEGLLIGQERRNG